MTTNTARRLTSALVLPLLLLAVGCDRGVVDPDVPEARSGAFTINSSQDAVNATTSEGTFKASGVIDDRGIYEESLNAAEPLHRLPSLHGIKTLEGTHGTIMIEFYVSLSATSQNTLKANGGFGIVEGSGAYADLQGGGQIDLEIERNATPATITQILEGRAWYAQ